MTKLENASNNFLEMVECVQNGEAIQWKNSVDEWREPENTEKDRLFIKLVKFKKLEWRKKPDAKGEEIEKVLKYLYDNKGTPNCHKVKNALFMVWDAAMEHKDND